MKKLFTILIRTTSMLLYNTVHGIFDRQVDPSNPLAKGYKKLFPLEYAYEQSDNANHWFKSEEAVCCSPFMWLLGIYVEYATYSQPEGILLSSYDHNHKRFCLIKKNLYNLIDFMLLFGHPEINLLPEMDYHQALIDNIEFAKKSYHHSARYQRFGAIMLPWIEERLKEQSGKINVKIGNPEFGNKTRRCFAEQTAYTHNLKHARSLAPREASEEWKNIISAVTHLINE